MTTWDPLHETTRDAWNAVLENLQRRQADNLWSSREVCVAIAKQAGLDRHRAVDLITSAIRHGHLEERDHPEGTRARKAGHTQVRLPEVDGGAR